MKKEYTDELMLDFGEDGNKLLPVVTQDYKTKDISRNELWKKGLTSGDMLLIKEIRINCEQNSLVYLVKPEGKGACHAKKGDGNPHSSCYYRKIEDNNTLTFIEE
jgi:phosphoribosyl-AMP cyclohydrolase